MLAFVLMLTCGVILYIVHTLLYYYYYIIIYLILYSSLLLILYSSSSSSQSSSSSNILLSSPLSFSSSSPSHSKYTCRVFHILIYIHLPSSVLFFPILYSSDLFLLSSSSHPNHLSSSCPTLPHSFYTCRHLDILIYIPGQFDPACFIGVECRVVQFVKYVFVFWC